MNSTETQNNSRHKLNSHYALTRAQSTEFFDIQFARFLKLGIYYPKHEQSSEIRFKSGVRIALFFSNNVSQASPITIGGRQAVIEIKRTTSRGN